MSITTKTSLLIVEDDPLFRETLVDAMGLKKIDARGVASAAEALTLLESYTPSIILMDVQLPDMHGFDLCRRLKRSERWSRLPIVLLSARYTEPADRAEGLLAGAEAYLSKPVNLEALWDEVSYLLDKNA
ncbi:MAG: response regulator [Elusimicrobia bacterium]|nr:response regulator [Elusimicrobiota bacterium]